jgi:hypothetical protein
MHRIRRSPVLALLSAAVLASCSRGGDEAPGDAAGDSRLLFPVPPTSSVVPAGGELERLFGGAPPPRFRTLRMVDETTSPAGQRRSAEREVHLVESAGWRSVVRIERRLPGALSVAQYEVGVPGLFTGATASDLASEGPAQRFLARVDSVVDVQGALFPLKVGNRLSFSARNPSQQWLGELVVEGSGSARYVYEVTGTTDRWSSGSPAVPGEVFVIRLTREISVDEMEMEGGSVAEVHFAPALGAVVWERVDTPVGPRESRVTGWE